jgi:hypothetical protein
VPKADDKAGKRQQFSIWPAGSTKVVMAPLVRANSGGTLLRLGSRTRLGYRDNRWAND